MSADALVLDEATHTYTLNGLRLWSVTQILGAAGLTQPIDYPPSATRRGHAVHRACALWAAGRLDEERLAAAWRPYLDAYKQATNDIALQVEHSELRLASSFGFAGTLDIAGHVYPDITPNLVILDIKTGVPEPCAELQTAGYAILYEAAFGVAYSKIKRGTLQLSDDGSYRLRWHDDPLGRHRIEFLAAISIAQVRRRYGLLSELEGDPT